MGFLTESSSKHIRNAAAAWVPPDIAPPLIATELLTNVDPADDDVSNDNHQDHYGETTVDIVRQVTPLIDSIAIKKESSLTAS